MAAILAGNNVEEEYLWSCTLTSTNKEYSWDPAELDKETNEGEEEKEGPKVKPVHRLLIKNAILMPSAKKDEVTVVQIESEGYNKQKVLSILMLLHEVTFIYAGHCSYLRHERWRRAAEVCRLAGSMLG